MKRAVLVVLVGLALLDICSYMESGSGIVTEMISGCFQNGTNHYKKIGE